MLLFKNIRHLEIEGKEYEIRTDFRDILNIMLMYGDDNLFEMEKNEIMYEILYKEKPPKTKETFDKAMLFLDCDARGLSYYPEVLKDVQKPSGKYDRLYSFEKDYTHIISAMNRYFGFSIRDCEYLHWWDFMSAFMDLGECMFGNIVSLRMKKQEGTLTKEEKKYYNENRVMLDLDYKSESLEDFLNNFN